jgi:acetylornithine deacetylase
MERGVFMKNESRQNPIHLESIDLLKRMIAIPSFSKEEKAVADLLEAFLTEKKLNPSRFENNVWCSLREWSADKPTLLLNSHIDTVKPNSGYTRDPFAPTVTEDKLYGLGSNDAGGCVVSLLAAFRLLNQEPDLHYNVIFSATAEEEISGTRGIEALLKHWRETGYPLPDCAIVGEPTGMQMAVAEKGLLVLDCVALGRSGHAARDEGDNAIYKALPDLEWFRNYRFERISPLLGPNKMTVTVIQAGSQHNVVPRECHFTVDVRINELYDFESVLQKIRSEIQSEVKPRSLRIKSTSIALDHPLVAAGSELGLTHYGSPTTSDKALMPFPALKMGPGESARSHTADEYILLEEIHQGIEIYLNLLRRVVHS